MHRLVVRWRDAATPEEIAHLESKLGLHAVRRIAPLRLAAYDDQPGLAEELEREPIVDYVEREEEVVIS